MVVYPLPAGGVRLTTTSTGAAAGAGYPEGGAEAMTGQSTLDLARSEENEDQLYAGSQQPLLQPQAADVVSHVTWEALTSLPTWSEEQRMAIIFVLQLAGRAQKMRQLQ